MNALYHVTKYAGRAISFVAPRLTGTLLVKAAPALRRVLTLGQRLMCRKERLDIALAELRYLQGRTPGKEAYRGGKE